MKDIKKVSLIVKEELERHPETRDNDALLYLNICEKMHPGVTDKPIWEVMKNRKALGIPLFETVGRARRKIQEKNEDLRGSDKATDARFENWKAVREYVETE